MIDEIQKENEELDENYQKKPLHVVDNISKQPLRQCALFSWSSRAVI